MNHQSSDPAAHSIPLTSPYQLDLLTALAQAYQLRLNLEISITADDGHTGILSLIEGNPVFYRAPESELDFGGYLYTGGLIDKSLIAEVNRQTKKAEFTKREWDFCYRYYCVSQLLSLVWKPVKAMTYRRSFRHMERDILCSMPYLLANSLQGMPSSHPPFKRFLRDASHRKVAKDTHFYDYFLLEQFWDCPPLVALLRNTEPPDHPASSQKLFLLLAPQAISIEGISAPQPVFTEISASIPRKPLSSGEYQMLRELSHKILHAERRKAHEEITALVEETPEVLSINKIKYVASWSSLALQFQNENAAADLKESLLNAPYDPEIHFSVGKFFELTSSPGAAAFFYKGALKLHPSYAEANDNLLSMQHETVMLRTPNDKPTWKIATFALAFLLCIALVLSLLTGPKTTLPDGAPAWLEYQRIGSPALLILNRNYQDSHRPALASWLAKFKLTPANCLVLDADLHPVSEKPQADKPQTASQP